jgi:GNAT superfamily N-acetyltransferase/quercetin dioxygenase-like cupin family protein
MQRAIAADETERILYIKTVLMGLAQLLRPGGLLTSAKRIPIMHARTPQTSTRSDPPLIEALGAGPSFRIRAAVVEDLPAMNRITRQAKAVWGYPQDLLESWHADLHSDAASLESCPAYVAIDAQERVWALAQIDPSSQPCELRLLFVDPVVMRQGLGRALLRHAARQAREFGHRSLQIDADPNALEFYLACGAWSVGQEPAPIAGEPGRVRPQLLLATEESPLQAVPTVQVDNDRVVVTEWCFAPGAQTGHHVHGHDYVVVPMTTGILRLVEPEGTRDVQLTAGVSYARGVGVAHNVINANDYEFKFIEIEIK